MSSNLLSYLSEKHVFEQFIKPVSAIMAFKAMQKEGFSAGQVVNVLTAICDGVSSDDIVITAEENMSVEETTDTKITDKQSDDTEQAVDTSDTQESISKLSPTTTTAITEPEPEPEPEPESETETEKVAEGITYTEDDVRDVLQQLVKMDAKAATQLMTDFGAMQVSLLKKEQYAGVIDQAEILIEKAFSKKA